MDAMRDDECMLGLMQCLEHDNQMCNSCINLSVSDAIAPSRLYLFSSSPSPGTAALFLSQP